MVKHVGDFIRPNVAKAFCFTDKLYRQLKAVAKAAPVFDFLVQSLARCLRWKRQNLARRKDRQLVHGFLTSLLTASA